jgi:hypothetical protein
MEAMTDTEIELKGAWRVLEAMASTGRDREPYAQLVLWEFAPVLAQLPDSLHSQTRKRTAVFQWALRAGAELEQLLNR